MSGPLSDSGNSLGADGGDLDPKCGARTIAALILHGEKPGATWTNGGSELPVGTHNGNAINSS